MDKVIKVRRSPVILPNGKVKRIGPKYYEVNRWAGSFWTNKRFGTRQEANEYIKKLEFRSSKWKRV